MRKFIRNLFSFLLPFRCGSVSLKREFPIMQEIEIVFFEKRSNDDFNGLKFEFFKGMGYVERG